MFIGSVCKIKIQQILSECIPDFIFLFDRPLSFFKNHGKRPYISGSASFIDFQFFQFSICFIHAQLCRQGSRPSEIRGIFIIGIRFCCNKFMKGFIRRQIFCLFPGMVFRQQISRRCGIPYFQIFRISRGSGIIITVRKFSFVRHHHTCGIRHSLIRHFIGSCCMIGLIGNGIIQICSVPGISIVFHLPVCKCARTYRLCF